MKPIWGKPYAQGDSFEANSHARSMIFEEHLDSHQYLFSLSQISPGPPFTNMV